MLAFTRFRMRGFCVQNVVPLWWIVDMMMVVSVDNRAGTQEETTTGFRWRTSKPDIGRSA